MQNVCNMLTATHNTERQGRSQRCVAQALAWIARQARPDLCRISKIQRTFERALARDLRDCNRTLEYAVFTTDRGIRFSFDFTWSDAVITTISGANFCQETEHCDDITQQFESQQAYIATLALGNALNVDEMNIHPLCWSSTTIRIVFLVRMCVLCVLCGVFVLVFVSLCW